MPRSSGISRLPARSDGGRRYVQERRCPLIRSRIAGLFVLVAALSLTVLGQSPQDDFDAWENQQEAEFDSFQTNLSEDYDAFVAQQDSLWRAFVANVDSRWADKVYPSRKDYVEYSDSYGARTHVDFETGRVEAAVLVDLDSFASALPKARTDLKAKLVQTMTTAGNTEPYVLADSVPETTGTPLLENQVADDSGRVVTPARVPEFAAKLVEDWRVKVDTVTGGDGRRRIRLTSVYDLVPNNMKVRAAKFREQIDHLAKRFELDPRLVFAVIHTESYFNPRAISHVPAYGLMQIVPKTAGVDAWDYLHSEQRLLKPDYLYDPEHNLEIGCAYLHLLRERHLRGAPSDQVAYPFMIAAYNGGIGTVCKAITGANRLPELQDSLKVIDYASALDRLKRGLPYKETRDYVTHVLERMALYDEWAN